MPRVNNAKAVVEADVSSLSGSPSAWTHVQTHYTAYSKGPSWSDFALIQVDAVRAQASLQQFAWYHDDYDKGYQGITSVTTPDGRFTILMPHPERVFRTVLFSWHPDTWPEDR